jgi:hypothetical protein
VNSHPDSDHQLTPIWQTRFAFFDRYGLPNATPQGRAALRALDFLPRLRLNSNLLAFLFGPIYFLVKGMWRKGLTLLVVGFAAISALNALGIPGGLVQALGFGVAAAAMLTANYAYYLQVRRGSRSWNPFEGFGRRQPG